MSEIFKMPAGQVKRVERIQVGIVEDTFTALALGEGDQHRGLPIMVFMVEHHVCGPAKTPDHNDGCRQQEITLAVPGIVMAQLAAQIHRYAGDFNSAQTAEYVRIYDETLADMERL